jgi:hypothetical protein
MMAILPGVIFKVNDVITSKDGRVFVVVPKGKDVNICASCSLRYICRRNGSRKTLKKLFGYDTTCGSLLGGNALKEIEEGV